MHLRLLREILFVVDKVEELISARIVVGRKCCTKDYTNGHSCEKTKVVRVESTEGGSLYDDWTCCIEGRKVSCTCNDIIKDTVQDESSVNDFLDSAIVRSYKF